jgi:hypothetical protein
VREVLYAPRFVDRSPGEIVAPSALPAVERFKDYLPAILASPRPVELFAYTPEEFDRMRAEERPFPMHALEGAKLVYEG